MNKFQRELSRSICSLYLQETKQTTGISLRAQWPSCKLLAVRMTLPARFDFKIKFSLTKNFSSNSFLPVKTSQPPVESYNESPVAVKTVSFPN